MTRITRAINLLNAARNLIEQEAQADSMSRETLEDIADEIGPILLSLEDAARGEAKKTSIFSDPIW